MGGRSKGKGINRAFNRGGASFAENNPARGNEEKGGGHSKDCPREKNSCLLMEVPFNLLRSDEKKGWQ